jgi:hypothetical protein
LLGVQASTSVPAGDKSTTPEDALAAELGLVEADDVEPSVDPETMIEETVEEVPEERGVKRDAEALAPEEANKKQKTVPFDEEAAFNA